MLAWTPFAVTLVTYMFLHGGWLHLIGNMLFLWVFGDDVEDALGQPGFIIFYLMAGMAAAMAQALPDPNSTVTVVGASGAISGVLGAYLVLYPRAQINVLVPIFIVMDVVRLPAWVVLLFWFAVQLLYEVAAPGSGRRHRLSGAHRRIHRRHGHGADLSERFRSHARGPVERQSRAGKIGPLLLLRGWAARLSEPARGASRWNQAPAVSRWSRSRPVVRSFRFPGRA